MKRTLGGSAFLSCLLLTNLLGAGPSEPPQDAPKINIVIVEGEGTLNNVKQRVNREPIVQVEDENHKPIAGAAVVFFLPTTGPGGTFANGSQTLTVTTDSLGRAYAKGIRPNHLTGKMEIRVTASANGQSVSATISQANIVGANVGGLSTTAKVLIAVGVIGAGVAIGVVVATHGGSSSSNPASTAITITPGTPTVGAPH